MRVCIIKPLKSRLMRESEFDNYDRICQIVFPLSILECVEFSIEHSKSHSSNNYLRKSQIIGVIICSTINTFDTNRKTGCTNSSETYKSFTRKFSKDTRWGTGKTSSALGGWREFFSLLLSTTKPRDKLENQMKLSWGRENPL